MSKVKASFFLKKKRRSFSKYTRFFLLSSSLKFSTEKEDSLLFKFNIVLTLINVLQNSPLEEIIFLKKKKKKKKKNVAKNDGDFITIALDAAITSQRRGQTE